MNNEDQTTDYKAEYDALVERITNEYVLAGDSDAKEILEKCVPGLKDRFNYDIRMINQITNFFTERKISAQYEPAINTYSKWVEWLESLKDRLK